MLQHCTENHRYKINLKFVSVVVSAERHLVKDVKSKNNMLLRILIIAHNISTETWDTHTNAMAAATNSYILLLTRSVTIAGKLFSVAG